MFRQGSKIYADADLAAPGGARPQFLQVAQPGVADAVGDQLVVPDVRLGAGSVPGQRPSGGWRRLDSATAPPLPARGAAAVWVSDIEGHREAHILTRRARRGGQRLFTEEVISGFTGRIRYVCDSGTETEAADFGALMAFAGYAGAGSHTTYGFGVLCPEPTWQPPTLRPGQS